MGKEQSGSSSKSSFIHQMELFLEKYKLPVRIAVAVVLLGLPFFGFSQYIMRIVIMIGVYTMLSMGLNILTGYIGQLSLGHAGFFGIGAYTGALLMQKLNVSFFLAAFAGACCAALCGLLLGLPTLRLKGTYLAIVTLGFGEIARMVFTNWASVTNGTLGVKNIPRPSIFGFDLTLANHGLYYLMLVLVALTTIGCLAIIRSKIGRSFIAIKEDEIAATMMGIQVTRCKVIAFVLSAFITGLAGTFYAPLVGFIDPNSFTFDVSSLIISIVILGGMGTLRGMFLGSAVLIIFPEVARFLMDYRFVVYGMILVLMMRFRPQGVLGWESQMPYKLPRLAREALSRDSAAT